MEGVADFFSGIVLQDSLSGFWENVWESPQATLLAPPLHIPNGYLCVNATSYECASGPLTVDGSLGEAPVAAFLYDLADNPSTKDTTLNWDDDAVSYGAAWVGDIIAACQVLYGGWVQHDAVDHLVYCFEHRLGGYFEQGYFPYRSTTTFGWRLVPGVPDPAGWNADAIRTIWQANMYVHGPPTTPVFTSISGYSEVRPNVQCLWTVGAGGGVPPYTFAWTVDDSPVGSGEFLYYVNAGSSFTVAVTATDAIGGTGFASFPASVSPEAQECLDQ